MKNDLRLIGLELVTPYELKSTSEMYRVPPPRMLIEGVLPVQSITGLTSYPGVGKTWFALEMARALAGGEPFLGNFKMERPGSVLFVGSDASEFDYADQWRRLSRTTWAKFVPSEEDLADPDYVEGPNLLEQNVRFLVMSDFLFENMDGVRRLIKTANDFEIGDPYWVPSDDEGGGEYYQDKGFSLIVFDTLSKLTRANQNDNSEMEDVFRNIRLITESTGAAVLLLHHNSKRNEFNDGSDWRGAMAQIGALDGWLNVSKPYKDKSKVKVEVKKFRGRQPKPFAYKMDVDGEVEATLRWIEMEKEQEKKKPSEEQPEEARTVPAVVEPTVPGVIRSMLRGGSKSGAEIAVLAVAVFNDEPEEKVKARVRSALNSMKSRGEVVRDRESKHYMLAGVDVAGSAAAPAARGGEQGGDI